MFDGLTFIGGTILGVKSAVTFLGRVPSNRGYDELRRFTMRGSMRPRLLTHLHAAARASVSKKSRALSLGGTAARGWQKRPRTGAALIV